MTPAELRKIAFRSKASARSGTHDSVAVLKRKSASKSRTGSLRSSILLCALLGVALLAGANRSFIVAQWSPSATIFALLGAPVNLRGLEISNLKSVLVEEDGAQVLTVEGDIRNVGGSILKVPELDMNVRGAMARTLYSWRAPSPRSALKKGETMTFRTRLSAPPDGAAEVHVRFSST